MYQILLWFLFIQIFLTQSTKISSRDDDSVLFGIEGALQTHEYAIKDLALTKDEVYKFQDKLKSMSDTKLDEIVDEFVNKNEINRGSDGFYWTITVVYQIFKHFAECFASELAMVQLFMFFFLEANETNNNGTFYPALNEEILRKKLTCQFKKLNPEGIYSNVVKHHAAYGSRF